MALRGTRGGGAGLHLVWSGLQLDGQRERASRARKPGRVRFSRDAAKEGDPPRPRAGSNVTMRRVSPAKGPARDGPRPARNGKCCDGGRRTRRDDLADSSLASGPSTALVGMMRCSRLIPRPVKVSRRCLNLPGGRDLCVWATDAGQRLGTCRLGHSPVRRMPTATADGPCLLFLWRMSNGLRTVYERPLNDGAQNISL